MVGSVGWSEINMSNNKDAITVPCGTLASIFFGVKMADSYRNEKNYFLNKI